VFVIVAFITGYILFAFASEQYSPFKVPQGRITRKRFRLARFIGCTHFVSIVSAVLLGRYWALSFAGMLGAYLFLSLISYAVLGIVKRVQQRRETKHKKESRHDVFQAGAVQESATGNVDRHSGLVPNSGLVPKRTNNDKQSVQVNTQEINPAVRARPENAKPSIEQSQTVDITL